MAQVTEDFARQMLMHTARGEHAPLTRWEEEQLARAWLCLNDARKLAAQQAEDDGLWFDAEHVTEDYLQRALRALTAVVEGSNEQASGGGVSRSRCKRLLGVERIEMGAIERELTALRNSTSWAIDRRRVDEAWAELATLRADIARLRADNQRLKDALFFWLPNIPAIENECTERMANDAALLIGHEGRIDDSAEQRGWITLSPNASGKGPEL